MNGNHGRAGKPDPGRRSQALLLFGSERAPARPLRLRAGPLEMLFEPDTGFLRRIVLGRTEAIRAIYAAVRDRNWGAVPPVISGIQSRIEEDSFRLRFDAGCHQSAIHFDWQGEITGDADGTVTFAFDGEARSSFFRNRIGFCLLHPLAGCAGQACEVDHAEGSRECGEFPRWVSPHQPFKQIRAIRHGVGAGLRVEASFEGDVFEMEDQRNWTDASFKTYCTPLELPFPALVAEGSRVCQKVTVRLLHSQEPPGRPALVATPAPPPPAATEFTPPEQPMLALPPIGLGLASHGQPLTPPEIERLRLLRLAHLRADLELSKPGWRQVLQRATLEARQLGCGLHLALFLTGAAEAELGYLAKEIEMLCPPVSLWLVFHAAEAATGENWVRLAQTALGRFGRDIPLAAGTNANFAELNRRRPAPDSIALPCFSINPQVHAFDTLSLTENLEAQAHTVETAHQFTGRPVVVSPVTLRPRFNAVATGEDQPLAPGELPSSVDPRQMSLFAAAWTLGSIAALTATGQVHSLTYYETTGWRGVMETAAGSPLSEKFPSRPGTVFPVFHLLASLAGFTQATPMTTAVPGTCAALALFAGRRRRLLVANLTGQDQPLRCCPPAACSRWSVLDETNVESALVKPERFLERSDCPSPSGLPGLVLKPHAMAVVDLA